MIYLDNSATTKPDPSVVESFSQAALNYFGNPSSLHTLGGESEKLLSSARQQVANLLEVNEQEIIFTSGGTESNNLVLKGIALEHENRGKHIITSMVEHPSVYDVCQFLENNGFKVTYLPVNSYGLISPQDVKKAITDETILMSLIHVNNELGSIQPIEEVAEIAKEYPKLYFHVDGVQAIGKVPVNLSKEGIDSYSISGHKIHGLKGTGILYLKERVQLMPLFHGGDQEKGIRSGTENVPGAVSIARALRLIKEKEKKNRTHLEGIHAHLFKGLERIPQVQVNSPKEGAPHILNISIPSFKPEVLIHALSKENIFVSTRSACSSKQLNENRILTACGHPADRALSALRISLSYDTTKEDVEHFLKVLEQAIIELKDVME